MAKSRRSLAIRRIAKRKEERLALLAQLRGFRERLSSDFKFDLDEAKSR